MFELKLVKLCALLCVKMCRVKLCPTVHSLLIVPSVVATCHLKYLVHCSMSSLHSVHCILQSTNNVNNTCWSTPPSQNVFCRAVSNVHYAKFRQSKQCKSRGSPRPLRDWIGPWTPKRIPEHPRRSPWPLRISPGHFRGPECVQNTLCREVWRPSVSRNTLY